MTKIELLTTGTDRLAKKARKLNVLCEKEGGRFWEADLNWNVDGIEFSDIVLYISKMDLQMDCRITAKGARVKEARKTTRRITRLEKRIAKQQEQLDALKS